MLVGFGLVVEGLAPAVRAPVLGMVHLFVGIMFVLEWAVWVIVELFGELFGGRLQRRVARVVSVVGFVFHVSP